MHPPKQVFEDTTPPCSKSLSYKRYWHTVLNVRNSQGQLSQTWRRHMTPYHGNNYGKHYYQSQIYQKILFKSYVICIQIVNVILVINNVIYITNIWQIWGLNRAMGPPLNSLYCSLIAYIHTYYNTLKIDRLTPSGELPILSQHSKYLCCHMLMTWCYLLHPLRSYRLCYIAYWYSAIPTL